MIIERPNLGSLFSYSKHALLFRKYPYELAGITGTDRISVRCDEQISSQVKRIELEIYIEREREREQGLFG